MAGHFLQRTTMMNLTVVPTPAQRLALTNLAYCCRSDHHNFSAPGSELFLASVHDGLVLSLLPHDDIRPGHIALNAIHRRVARVSVGDTVSASRFIQPDDFNLVLLSLELEFVNRGTKSEQVDAAVLANQLRENFDNQVLTVGQKVAFEYYGNKYIFKVTQAVVRGCENLKSDPERGIFSANTFIVFEASSASGIKIDGTDVLLPDEIGRLHIFRNQIKKMKGHPFLSPDVNLQELAARARNYTEAEIGGVVHFAASFALYRQLSVDDLTVSIDGESSRVTMEDFLKALCEITPAFGASTKELEACRLKGMVDFGGRHKGISGSAMQLAEQVRAGEGGPLVTCLLEGPIGSGKTAVAATIGIDSDFPYVKKVSAQSMVGLDENTKCAQIIKVFEDAYKSTLSVIVLDDIERLLEYCAVGRRFSNLLCQTVLILLKRDPPEGKRLLVIGTTSEISFLDEIGFQNAFTFTYHVPALNADDAKKVLQQLNVFAEEDIDEAAELLNDVPIKKLYSAVGMAAMGKDGGSFKIDINHFKKCLRNITKLNRLQPTAGEDHMEYRAC